MKFTATPIAGVILIEPQVFGDERGFFMETWQQPKFSAAGIDAAFVQDNHSRSTQWTLRGLHFQVRHTQGKLVRVTAGAVFDAVVDLRQSSPSYGRSWGTELSEANHRMLWVPPGLAHGILITSPSADFLYKCTDLYSPADERSLAWDDPAVGIAWPLPAGTRPKLSAKDAKARASPTSRNSRESPADGRRRTGRPRGRSGRARGASTDRQIACGTQYRRSGGGRGGAG